MSETFERAQRAALRRWGVEAASCRVHPAVLDGGSAHVLVSGEGPPVVLLNGVGTPAAMLAPLLAELDGHRLHAIDLPGFGLTDALPGFARDLRGNAIEFLTGVMDELGLDHASIVSNSLGSLFATWYALDRPERVTSMVQVGCPALALGTAAPLPMRMIATPGLGWLMMRLRPPSPGQVRELSKMVREHPLEPEIAELLLQTERLPHFEPAFRSVLRRLLRIRGARPEHALTAAQLQELAQPLQLVWGADDPFGPPRVGEEIARIVQRGECHVVPGGHAPWLGSAETIGQVVRPFLARQPALTA